MDSCGCKICKNNLGEFTNDLAIAGDSLNSIKKKLINQNLSTTERTITRHLSAFSIPINVPLEISQPIKVDLNNIDFSKYDFKINDVESVVNYLQKLNLKILLNQSEITLQAQLDVLAGNSPGIPKEIIQNQALAYQLFERSAGIQQIIDRSAAIKTVESLGLEIKQLKDVPDTTNTETISEIPQ